jgi:hypothetical protein
MALFSFYGATDFQQPQIPAVSQIYRMLQQLFHEQFIEAEKELQDLEKERQQLQINSRLLSESIFDICRHVDNEHNECNWEGDDDILKINFAGKLVDIKRSTFTKPLCGHNLFSSLFQKKWDEFHVRDKTGRIYVDYNGEWLKPLLEYMEYNDEDAVWARLPTSNYSLVQIMRNFQMDKVFKLYSTASDVHFHGLPYGNLYKNTLDQLRKRYFSFHDSSCFRVDLKSVYKHSSAAKFLPSPNCNI